MKTYETFEQAKEAFNAVNETKYYVTCCLGDYDADIVAEELNGLGVQIIYKERNAFGHVIFNVAPSILKVDDDLIEEWQENAIYVDVY